MKSLAKIAENLSPSELTKQQQGRLQDSNKRKQIAQIVRQCFDILDTYGKPPEALENLILAMIEDLLTYELDEISAAFKHWRKTKTKIPTPAEILEIIRYGRPKKIDYFQPTPEQIEEWNNGKNVDRKPWHGKTWKQIQEQGLMPQVEGWLIELTRIRGKERAEGYLQFLMTGPINKPERKSA